MTHTDIINLLIKKFGFKSYLEIGIDNPNNNYLLINAEEKECVDPFIKTENEFKDAHEVLTEDDRNYIIENIITYRMTSDEMFKMIPEDKKYDFVFIDGLHTEEQVGRDIVNSFKHLNKGGYVLVHDCLPINEDAQKVPRVSGTWNGDVWKALPILGFQGISYSVIECDYGNGLLAFNGDESKLEYPEKADYEYKNIFSSEYIKKIVMHTVSEEEFMTWITNVKNPQE